MVGSSSTIRKTERGWWKNMYSMHIQMYSGMEFGSEPVERREYCKWKRNEMWDVPHIQKMHRSAYNPATEDADECLNDGKYQKMDKDEEDRDGEPTAYT